MNDIRERLVRSFAAIFPDLTPSAIPRASQTSVQAWDSTATVTLLSVIEEEFGVSFDLEELENLTSFDLILARLEQLAANRP